MASRDELAASRAAHEAYATEALRADHAAHVDVGTTGPDRPATPDPTETAFGATRPEWANTRGSGSR
jgi:hypothetical protein